MKSFYFLQGLSVYYQAIFVSEEENYDARGTLYVTSFVNS